MNLPKLMEQLERHEGRRAKPYLDSRGKWTIGVGHNLSDKGLPDEIIDELFVLDIDEALAGLDVRLPWWKGLDDVRARAVADMAFQLGVGGLLNFAKALAAIKSGKWEEAKDELLESAWAKQAPTRAFEIAEMIRTGR
jgi:lysozyme